MREKSLSLPEILYRMIPLPCGEEEYQYTLAEPVRDILADLTKICRYERRAASRRDRAIGKIKNLEQDRL
jgi:hypothetical protein